MFNLFKKDSIKLIKHRYKNLLIALPANWEYEFEQDEQEACFDPKCQSTLRLNILKVVHTDRDDSQGIIEELTDKQSYTITQNEHLLTQPTYIETIESGENITLISWRLINNVGYEKIIAIITYTVLTKEKDSKKEKTTIDLIENSLKYSELSN